MGSEVHGAVELSRYEVLGLLAEGAFGRVYRGRIRGAEGFATQVAIKLLHADLERRPDLVRRFRDEARVLGLLEHPAIVRVHALEEVHGRWVLVMEYLPGVALDRVIEHVGALPIRPVAAIGARVASALVHAWEHMPHGHGAPLRVEHRDIKPGNLIVDADGSVKVLDFGIARAQFEAREAHTRGMGSFGTLAYMPQERWLGRSGPGGDMFALAVTLLEAATGVRPPTSERIDDFDDWRGLLLARAPSDLAEVCRPALDADPTRRPGARDVRDGLMRLADVGSGPALERWATQEIEPLVHHQHTARHAAGGREPPSSLPRLLGLGSGTPDTWDATAGPAARSGAPGDPSAGASARSVGSLGARTAVPSLGSVGGAPVATVEAEPPASGHAPRRPVRAVHAVVGVLAVAAVLLGLQRPADPAPSPSLLAQPVAATPADGVGPERAARTETDTSRPGAGRAEDDDAPSASAGPEEDRGGTSRDAPPRRAERPAPIREVAAARPAPPTDPAPAPAGPAPTVPPNVALVRTPGDAWGMRLRPIDGGKTLRLPTGGAAEVPPGTYEVRARLGGELPVPTGLTVELTGGRVWTLTCVVADQACTIR